MRAAEVYETRSDQHPGAETRDTAASDSTTSDRGAERRWIGEHNTLLSGRGRVVNRRSGQDGDLQSRYRAWGMTGQCEGTVQGMAERRPAQTRDTGSERRRPSAAQRKDID